MRALPVLMFIFLIPFFGAIGHDLYITYKDQDFTKPMMFSDAGYLWTTYEPTSFEWAKSNIDPETWSTFLTPVLEQTTIILTGIPVVIIGLIMLLMKFANLPAIIASRGHKGGKGGFSFKGGLDKKQKNFEYKRKKS